MYVLKTCRSEIDLDLLSASWKTSWELNVCCFEFYNGEKAGYTCKKKRKN